MELPQPRPFEAEGRKPTHDFLSLYSHSSVQQDPRPPSQGGHLKTHDFLQPLERVDKTSAKEEPSVEKPTSEKPPPPAPPPPMEHVLPGGIGTYSISHISYFNQRLPKPDGALLTVAQASSNERNDENSNCSSYTGSGFTLWEESAVKKGKTGKENAEERPILTEAAVKVGNWPAPERPSQSSTNNHRSSYSSLSSSQSQGQKSQSFMEMIKSAKGSPQDDDLDDEEEFVLKESSTTQNGELRVKVDGKSTGDQKPNTPRSKHSATEQRRRSKINDRFHMLRELIPHSDQKRDKASFLLEVIEYIQFLQEKVHKYEGSYQGWNHEPTKLIPWRNSQWPAENFGDQSRGINSVPGPAIMFAAKLDEKNITVSPTVPPSVQIPVESDISTATTLNAMNHCPVMINKAMPFPMSLQPHLCSVRSGGMVAQLPNRLDSDAENIASQPRTQLCHSRSCNPVGTVASDKLKEQELAIEGGSISISSVYSQGLLNTLTQALQSSGVDLSKASISVQIELGKQANIRSTSRASIVKDNEIPSSKQGTARSRVASEESNQALKKQKIVKS